MPKFILFLALGFSLLSASELSEFQRAQALEQSGDIKGAMQIYKARCQVHFADDVQPCFLV